MQGGAGQPECVKVKRAEQRGGGDAARARGGAPQKIKHKQAPFLPAILLVLFLVAAVVVVVVWVVRGTHT